MTMIGMMLAAVMTATVGTNDLYVTDAFATYPETVIINDRNYVVMSEEYYASMTNWVKKITALANREWNKQHQTEAGRREWHGKLLKHWVDKDSLKQITEYEDGYRLVEDLKPVRKTAPSAKKENKTAAYKDNANIPSRLNNLSRKRHDVKVGKALEIIQNHTANGGSK